MRWLFSGVPASGALVFLVVLAPSAAAGNFSLQFNPPYAGIGEIVTQQYTSGCHASAHFTSLPRANVLNGHLGVGMAAGSGGCHNASDAGIQASLGIRGPTFVANATGHPSVHVRLLASWDFAISVTPGTLARSSYAQADVIIGTELFDNTSGTPFVVGYFYYTAFSNWSWNGSDSGHASGIAKMVFALAGPVAISTGHTYFVDTVVAGEVYGWTSHGGSWSGSVHVGPAGAPTVVLGVSIY